VVSAAPPNGVIPNGVIPNGVFSDMPMAEYQAVKALSAGGAWILSEECPARYWQESPFNPEATAETRRAFDIGTALHLAVLEPDVLAQRVIVINTENYRTKSAQEAREAAYAAGKTPLLAREFALVEAMDLALRRHRIAAELLAGGRSEVSLFWQDEDSGVACKARVDRIAPGWKHLIDLKTCASAAPRAFQARAFDDGHFLRAAWYLEGAIAVTGTLPDSYIFVCVEKDPPHVVSCFTLDERALAWGAQIMRRALRRFARCQAAQDWRAGYVQDITTLGLPSWSEYWLADREAAGEFTSALGADAMRRGNAFLRP
jgi:hypothetical protein